VRCPKRIDRVTWPRRSLERPTAALRVRHAVGRQAHGRDHRAASALAQHPVLRHAQHLDPERPLQHDLRRASTTIRGGDRRLREVVAAATHGRNNIFALAEISFAYAEHRNDPAYYRSAAVSRGCSSSPVTTSARRARRARAPSRRISTTAASHAASASARTATSCRAPGLSGAVRHARRSTRRSQLDWMDRKLVKFVPVAELDVEGLATRYRWSGIGAPLAPAPFRSIRRRATPTTSSLDKCR